jgi:AbrB family looped-hinge helix DNA binding protein
MLTTVDAAGRIMLPKALRETLAIKPGMKVDVTAYGAGLALIPQSRSARLVHDDHGHLVAQSATVVTDEDMYALIDAGRK